jgi:hypothetical protein
LLPELAYLVCLLPLILQEFDDKPPPIPLWLRAFVLIVFILACVGHLISCLIFLCRFPRRPFMALDVSGLSCIWKDRGAVTPWPQIVACSCKNDGARTLLRIYPKRAQPPRSLSFSNREDHFDIDFALAHDPRQSLDEAFRACVKWIAATRDASATDSPIREFVDGQPAPNVRPSKTRSLVNGLLLAFLAVVVILVAMQGLRRPLIEEPPGMLDERPGQSVLFLGNSRITTNDLPRMVREVADSAQSPIRYDVAMRAWGGATFEEHWNDAGDRAALQKPWGRVILQTQSVSFVNQQNARGFADYGERLIRAAKEGGSPVALIANWTLGTAMFEGDATQAAALSKMYGERIEQQTRALAERAGAEVIDLERAFADAEALAPEIALTSDGNHPTQAGTFLAAVVIYGWLSQDDVAKVSWRPPGMSEAAAAKLKDVAARSLR